MKDNERVYDTLIYPLMKRIIEICKEQKIPMVANFQLSDVTFAKTLISVNGMNMVIEMQNALSDCVEADGAVNMDKFFIWCNKKYENKSSIIMHLLGNKVAEQ